MRRARIYASLLIPDNRLALPPMGHDHFHDEHVQRLREASKDDRWASALVAIHAEVGPHVVKHLALWLAHPVDPGSWTRWDFVADTASYDAHDTIGGLAITSTLLPSPFSPEPLTEQHLAALPHLTAKGLRAGHTMHRAAVMLAEHHRHVMYHPES